MRVKGGVVTRRRHKRLLKQAKGYRGRRGSCFQLAERAVEKGLQYAYRDRRARKREYRGIWIVRINAAARNAGISYSRLIRGLKLANIEMDRKVLAELCVSDPQAFAAIAEKAKGALA
jgi:large subunit ribosomal protein L20